MLVEDAVEIWVYTEIESEIWVKELGDPYDPIMGGDMRTIGSTVVRPWALTPALSCAGRRMLAVRLPSPAHGRGRG